MNCTVDDCTATVRSIRSGLCNKHYERLRNTGTTDPRPPRLCDEPDCERKHFTKGLCSMHVRRLAATGTTAQRVVPTLAERLTNVTTEGDCWIWNGAPGKNGYGRISVDNQLRYVHRVSYEHYVGPIPDGLTIDHLCRVRMCINPAHLEPVTLEENTRRELEYRYSSKESA